MDYDLRLVGTNTEFVSPGNHLCDQVYEVPFSFDKSYPSIIRSICESEQVDLLIPSTDFESYYLSRHQNDLPKVVTSPPHVNEIFLDKYLTYRHFQETGIPFATSIFPVSEYRGQFDPIVVKPRTGRGSRNVFFEMPDKNEMDDTYFVQKRYFGTEITTAFYVTRNQQLHGHITLRRELAFGTTSKCTVVFDYDEMMNDIISKVIENFNILGPCNIQSIVTETGEIVPFEINARISGTNSIRSQFGFEDVKYIIEEYVFDKAPSEPNITGGSALRILMDVIYPEANLEEIKNKTTAHYVF